MGKISSRIAELAKPSEQINNECGADWQLRAKRRRLGEATRSTVNGRGPVQSKRVSNIRRGEKGTAKSTHYGAGEAIALLGQTLTFYFSIRFVLTLLLIYITSGAKCLTLYWLNQPKFQ